MSLILNFSFFPLTSSTSPLSHATMAPLMKSDATSTSTDQPRAGELRRARTRTRAAACISVVRALWLRLLQALQETDPLSLCDVIVFGRRDKNVTKVRGR